MIEIKYLKYLSITFVSVLVGMLFSNTTTVSADTEDYAQIIKTAPKGININKYFVTGKYKDTQDVDKTYYTFNNNGSTVDQSAGPHQNQILNLAQGGQVGAVGAAWSNEDTENYIDVTKPQTVSVWLYFGSSNSTDPATNGQGMSFVLQNDVRGPEAMGSGYQGLGSMGFDGEKVGMVKSLGLFWGYNPEVLTGGIKINSPEQAAQTAVGNSIALNFNSEPNSLITNSKIDLPIKLASKPFGLLNRTDEYTLNSFSTTYGGGIPDNYPLVKNSANQTTLGNSGGNGYGTITLTYPGLPLTYKQIKMSDLNNPDLNPSNEPWTYVNGGGSGKLLSTYQVNKKPASLINGTNIKPDNNGNKTIYWHHLTFTWEPATNSSPAMIHYDYNDKYPDGTINHNQKGTSDDYREVSCDTAVDVNQLHPDSKNRVYWGLTGANSNNSSVYSKLAIFESIPALASVDVKTKLIDTTLGNKEITDSSKTNNLTGSAKATADDNNVFNGDDLIFDYNLAWNKDESRTAWTKINSELNLPPNVDYKSAVVTYSGPNGDSQPITINSSQGLTSGQLAFVLQDLGIDASHANNYTSAKIDITGTAVNKDSLPITDDPAVATFTGENAIETTSTPTFVINPKALPQKSLSLTVSKDLEFQDVNYRATSLLKRKSNFTLSVTSMKEPWTLSVSSDGLNNGKQPFYGNLIYQKNSTDEPLELSNQPQQIDSDAVSHDQTTVDNISGTWNERTGLLLRPDSQKVTPAGKYTGKLTWTLVSSTS